MTYRKKRIFITLKQDDHHSKNRTTHDLQQERNLPILCRSLNKLSNHSNNEIMHDLQKEKNLPDLENESIYSIGLEINSTITARTE